MTVGLGLGWVGFDGDVRDGRPGERWHGDAWC